MKEKLSWTIHGLLVQSIHNPFQQKSAVSIEEFSDWVGQVFTITAQFEMIHSHAYPTPRHRSTKNTFYKSPSRVCTKIINIPEQKQICDIAGSWPRARFSQGLVPLCSQNPRVEGLSVKLFGIPSLVGGGKKFRV